MKAANLILASIAILLLASCSGKSSNVADETPPDYYYPMYYDY